jgi:hypothetical protein
MATPQPTYDDILRLFQETTLQFCQDPLAEGLAAIWAMHSQKNNR